VSRGDRAAQSLEQDANSADDRRAAAIAEQAGRAGDGGKIVEKSVRESLRYPHPKQELSELAAVVARCSAAAGREPLVGALASEVRDLFTQS